MLFGDGAAAVVLQATDREEGLIGEKLGCNADVRGILRVRGMGTAYAHHGVMLGDTRVELRRPGDLQARGGRRWRRRRRTCWRRRGHTVDEIDLVVPHQANLRIIESVAKRVGAPMERVYVTVQRYGNMSSATVPVALVDALEEGRVKPRRADPDAGVRRRPHLVLAPRALGRAHDADRARPTSSCRRARRPRSSACAS